MPFVRCNEYDADGKPLRIGGCPKKSDCRFVHPDQPSWKAAPEPWKKSRPFSSERGRGRGRGGLPTGPRGRTGIGSDITGSNAVGRGSSASGDSGWGSRSRISSGAWGAEADKGEGSSTIGKAWSKAWGGADNSTKDDWKWLRGSGIINDSTKDNDGDKDKGKGKATESSWGRSQMDVDKDDNKWGWGNATSKTTDASKDGGWGASSPTSVDGEWRWGKSSPKATETKVSGWNVPETSDEQTGARDAPASYSIDERHASGPGPAKKAKPGDIMIPPPEPPAKMDVDSPRTSIPPASATSLSTVKPFNAGPNFLRKRYLTPDMSEQSSRSGSLVPAIPPPKEMRGLKSVSHKESRNIWSDYIEHIRRPVMLKLLVMEERARYKNYRSAQNSPSYIKVGRRGTTLLDESMRELRGRLDRDEKEYKRALDKLCAFEEGFDFPMHMLTGRTADIKKMREELAILREYVKETKACVDNMRITVDDIETQARSVTAPAPAPTTTSVIKDEPQNVQSEHPGLSEREEVEKRLVALKEKAMDLFNAFLDVRKGSNVDDVIQEKMEETKMSFHELLGTDGDGFSERINKLSENYTSLGRDLDELCSDIAGLYISFKETELAADQETRRLRELLEEDRRLLVAGETDAQTCQSLLQKSTEHIDMLQQEIRSFEELRSSNLPSPSAPSGLPENILDQLVAALLPAVRERLYGDIDVALRNMTSSAEGVVQDRNKKQVQALSAVLEPLYKVSDELHSKVDLKSQRLAMCSKPSSPYVGEARPGVPVQASSS